MCSYELPEPLLGLLCDKRSCRVRVIHGLKILTGLTQKNFCFKMVTTLTSTQKRISWLVQHIFCMLWSIAHNCVKLDVLISKETATIKSSTMLPQPPAVTLLSCLCKLMSFSTQILMCTHTSQHRIFHKKQKKRRKRGTSCFLLPLISLFYISAKAMNQHYIALGTAQIEQKIFPLSQICYNLSLEGK